MKVIRPIPYSIIHQNISPRTDPNLASNRKSKRQRADEIRDREPDYTSISTSEKAIIKNAFLRYLPQAIPGFWPETGCVEVGIVVIDLFSYESNAHEFVPLTPKLVPIARSIIYPLVLRPFEFLPAGTEPALSRALNSSSSDPESAHHSLTAQKYRLLPSPRDPIRVMQMDFTDVERSCAKLSHWQGYEDRRYAF